MEVLEILERIELGEDSTTQLKENITNNTSLAEEQESQKLHADELVVYGSKIDDIDDKLLNYYYEKEYSGDLKGNIPELYKKAMSFITRNLHKRQNDKNFNSEGDLEIPKIVFEELLVNAIIHRDYFIEAPINLFIFDNRIEIISPGKLPNSLSVENIKHGISVIRNPIITSIASKLLPYRGIGSGIVRAIKNYEKIDFINDVESERFKAVIYR